MIICITIDKDHAEQSYQYFLKVLEYKHCPPFLESLAREFVMKYEMQLKPLSKRESFND